MKKLSAILILLLTISIFCSCSTTGYTCDILATTLPVYEFTTRICQNTGLTVARLITENVSCLHDYTLDVKQMRSIESAKLLVLSGVGLEDFMDDAIPDEKLTVDASQGLSVIESDAHEHDGHVHTADDGHHHNHDPHIWLCPDNAIVMAQNIYTALCECYPENQEVLLTNLSALLSDLQNLQAYGEAELSQLSCRDLITFHDGFAYFAQSFDLTILRAVEEESGSEASAAEIIELAELIKEHHLPAIFVERSGSDACARILHDETSAQIYMLDMAMSGDSYFDAMYHNIHTIKEALE